MEARSNYDAEPTLEQIWQATKDIAEEVQRLKSTLQMVANTMVVEISTGGATSHMSGLRQWANQTSSYTNVAPNTIDVRNAFATVLMHLDNCNDTDSSLLLKWEELQKEVREQAEVLHERIDEILEELDG